ncbi:hypothetical protein GGTG_12070 [Gaeumannomyces tritici R3-111a-1]|uniref:Major facilitator superfamily (MFS) profile domain-containing protein n=1 Tax=Gaeumannomyces tritici (strain R3-111a-1) TaxID=644352 RepID=J3PEZ1_GAET3|nr:hypothetical protein GGTG_12070 [Gaeumannomyces tritici R3-111a-1]EJT71049.1 hypothetical protein GGTG_12070 [Gaeumannomyces tritici R3-111a-1]
MADNGLAEKNGVGEGSKSGPASDFGSVQQPQLSIIRAVRRWPKVSLWVFLQCASIILVGFDISIVSNVASLPQFQHDFGQPFGDTRIIPALWIGLWNGIMPVGSIAGAFSAGVAQDFMGRRLTLAFASALSAVCVAVAFVSDLPADMDTRRGVFLLAKTAHGFANGALICAVETWTSEVLPSALRGPGVALYPIFTLVGQLVGSLVVQGLLNLPGATSYRAAFATQWPFTALSLTVALLAPESPAWLVRVGRLDAARASHARLDSSPTEAERDAAFEEIRGIVRTEREQAGQRDVAYSECFRGVDTRRTLVTVFARCLPNLFGLPLFATASYFLQMIGVEARVSLLFMLAGVLVGLFSNLISLPLLARFNRRTLLIPSLAACSALWTSIGIAGCFMETGNATVVRWFVSVAMMGTMASVSVGAWPAAHVVNCETSSLRLRARAQGLAGMATQLLAGVFSIALPYIYSPDQGSSGPKVGFLFAGFSALAVVGTWLYVPEMKDRDQLEIDIMFEQRLPARAFRGWKGDPGSVVASAVPSGEGRTV